MFLYKSVLRYNNRVPNRKNIVISYDFIFEMVVSDN